MPRRRQAHFKADKSRQPEVLGGGTKSVRLRHDRPKYDGGDRCPNERKSPWDEEETLNQPSCYSHKKFKKMEPSSTEGSGSGGEGSSPGVRPPMANLSLEALFQVTGHELEKIKLSSQDSDSSEQCATMLEGEEEEEEGEEDEEKKKAQKRKPSEAIPDGRKCEAEDLEASKRRRHSCPYCGLGCGKPSVLQKHIRAHTNERPYPCIPCGFSFKTKSNLYKHCKSRAHHLKVSDEVEVGVDKPHDRLPRRCYGEDEGETDGSTNSARDEDEDDDGFEKDNRRTTTPSSSASGVGYNPGTARTAVGGVAEANVPSHFATAGEDKRSGGMLAVMPTSIYKPKFHSVPYIAPSPCQIETLEVGSPLNPIPKGNSEAEPRYADEAAAVVGGDPTPIRPDASKGCLAEGTSVVSEGPSSTSLSKRRNEQFQLRLEIPRSTLPPPAVFPRSSSLSSSSSSSCSISSRSVQSPSVAASRPEPMTNGECLPVPVVVSGIGYPSTSHGGESLSRTLKSPKLASPEYLQQHISKLISQNAAIVETLDPLWPRRYTRQNSVASSHNVDAELGGSKEQRFRRYSEDVALPTKSKLALALLASASQPSTSESRDGAQTPSTAVKGFQAMSLTKEVPRPEEAKESDGGSIVRSLLLVDNAKRSNPTKKNEERMVIDVPHPQNPEGSIIKDLLLKTRSTGHTRQASALATCMRLSGGSVSASNSASAIDGSTTSPPRELLLQTGEHQARDDASFVCTSCNISYKKAETLEAHRRLYCSNSAGKVLTMATSGGSFSVPAPSKDSSSLDDAVSSGIIPCNVRGINTGHELLAPPGELLCQKPRGRPRGSKNRPKLDAVCPLGVRPVPKVVQRTHSKSASESGSEILQMRDKTIDALKGKLCYRRNSVSGDGASDSPRVAAMGSNFDSVVSDGDPERATFESWRSEKCIEDGPILKKHLLGGDKMPPLKKRKGSEKSIGVVEPDGVKSSAMASTVLSLKSLEQLSKYPMRPSAIHLFGGEVQICDGAETKKIVIDNKIQGMSSGNFLGGGVRGSDSTTSSVVATIAKPVHNSGGTVLQVQDSKMSLVNKPVCIPVVSLGRPLMATSTENARTSLAGNVVLLSPKPAAASQQFSIDISHLKLLNPSPMLARSPSFDYSALPPVLIPFPNSHSCPDGPIKKDDRGEPSPICDDTPLPDSSKASKVPLIAIHSPKSPSVSSASPLPPRCPPETTASGTLLPPARPTTLALNKSPNTSVGMTLVSPETPRPKKKYGQCYHNGQYYTYLELKQSTRVFYCNYQPIPMYVPQSVDPKLSMYSMWERVPPKPDPFGLTPPQSMSLYRSKQSGGAVYSEAKSNKPLMVTHSTYWTFQQNSKDDIALPSKSDDDIPKVNGDVYREVDEEGMESDVSSRKGLESEEDDNNRIEDGMASKEERQVVEGTPILDDALFKGEVPLKHRLKDALEIGIHEPRRVKIFEGGFKSNEDYTYVRGRGRGKYVCEECGIRCKKPSMLKKHIRTHTDVRPYTCKHCNFSFKTKGNLTKHMKSKAHHKKCVELGIVPVPVTIDDAQIDEEALARQERIEHQRKQFADVDEDSALEEDEDEDDEDDEYYDQTHEEYKEGENEDDESMELEGQFEDANEPPLNNRILALESLARKGCPEQEIARSLLDLGKPDIPVGFPSSIPSSPLFDIRALKEVAFLQRPTMSTICHSLKRDDEREELIGNPRVAWASCQSDGPNSPRSANIISQSNVYESSYDEMMDRTEDISVGSNSRERIVQMNPSVDSRNIVEHDLFIPQSDAFTVAKRTSEEGAYAPHSTERRSIDVVSTNDDCDQPIDLSMPHTRGDQPAWDNNNEEEEEGVEDDEDDEEEVDDEEDDEDEIVVDDDVGEKAEPYYCSFPEFEEGRVDPDNILSPARQEKMATLPHRLQSPCQEEGSEGSRYGSNEWAEKRAATSPQCSMLHSYLSDQSPTKRVSIEVVATVSHHRSSVSSYDERDSSSAALMTVQPTRTPLYGYSTSPTSRVDSLLGLSTKISPDRRPHLPSTSVHNMPQYIHRSLDDDKCVCTICNKAFNKPSQLKLHVNIHYFERPFRCDSCAISFRTKGHLQKHKRSVSHYNKVNMNMTFGTPTTDNPRPFKCDDCKIAFRIHGHLAKHLRSKMHIMKLECLGKLPFGTYAEIERSGANLNEIDTTDCENSLESLQVMANRLVDKVAVPQHWPRERTISGGSCDDQSDGVPYVESPLPVPAIVSGGAANCAANIPRQFGSSRSLSEDGCVSPDLIDTEHLVSWSRKSFDGDIPALPSEAMEAVPALPSAIKCELGEKHQLPHLMNLRAKTVLATVIRRQDDKQPISGQRTRSASSLIQEYEDISDEDASEMESNKRGAVCFACRICGKSLKSAKFLQLHMYVDHADNAVAASETSSNRTFESDASSLHSNSKRRKTSSSPLLSISLATSTTIAGEGFRCQLCGERFSSSHNLKQHMGIHAQIRPFVCGICDAGFTNSHYLKLHTLQSHQQEKSFACQECNLVFGLGEDLKHHMNHSHPAMDGDRVR